VGVLDHPPTSQPNGGSGPPTHLKHIPLDVASYKQSIRPRPPPWRGPNYRAPTENRIGLTPPLGEPHTNRKTIGSPKNTGRKQEATGAPGPQGRPPAENKRPPARQGPRGGPLPDISIRKQSVREITADGITTDNATACQSITLASGYLWHGSIAVKSGAKTGFAGSTGYSYEKRGQSRARAAFAGEAPNQRPPAAPKLAGQRP
jgi:hypothetical protein